jgi:hypothetical protein
MKTFIAGIFIVSFFLVTGFAQSSSLWLGAHAGADIGTVAIGPPDAVGTITSKTGIAVGAEADYWISDNYGISAQPAYVQKGFNTQLNDGSFAVTYRYLQLPVLFKFTFGSGALKPFFFAGPEFGLKLSVTQSGPVMGKDTTITAADSLVTKSNIGILVGAGINYQVNSATMLFLQAGYDHGLSNISPNSREQTLSTRDIRTSLGILLKM